MSSISNILSLFPDFQQPSSQSPLALKTQQFRAQAQTATQSQLSILTAEGDRVSLSIGSERHVSFDTYTFQGLADGQTLDFRNQELRTSARSDLNLFVEGDLNEQERADIQAFIQTVQDLFTKLGSENVDAAADTALSLGDLQSLSSAALFFRQETTISVESRSTELALQENGRSRPSGEPGSVAVQGPTIEGFLERIRKAQEQFQIDPDRLSKQLPTLLSSLIDTLDKPAPNDETPPSLFEQIRKKFLQTLLQAIKNPSTEKDFSHEVIEEAKNSEGENSALSPTTENDEILVNPSRTSGNS